MCYLDIDDRIIQNRIQIKVQYYPDLTGILEQ